MGKLSVTSEIEAPALHSEAIYLTKADFRTVCNPYWLVQSTTEPMPGIKDIS